MKKRVLLISPQYMGLYKDIMNGMEEKDYEVTFMAQEYFPNNPYNQLYNKHDSSSLNKFQNFLKDYWKKKLESFRKDELWFDFMLVVDGLTFHPFLLESLRSVNPNIYAVNYLYDRVKGVYQIDQNFKYFNKVFSFDRSDTAEYNLVFLPIYWVPCQSKGKKTDVFGFGAYDATRMQIFKRIIEIADEAGLDYFIKIYHPPIKNKFNYAIRRSLKLLFTGKENLSLKELEEDIFTHQSLSTNVFREWINGSDVIIDTNHPYQDGLTARFMWALGEGKKIITNNHHVRDYKFYSEEQVLVIDEYTSKKMILDFIQKDFIIPSMCIEEVRKFRIDNWLDRLFNEPTRYSYGKE